MKKYGLSLIILALAITVGSLAGYFLRKNRVSADINTPAITTPSPAKVEANFAWGATVRPYILIKNISQFKPSDVEKQFAYVKDLFPVGGVVRANIEADPYVNDLLVEYAQKYDLKLYLILEEIKDFNPEIDYRQKANDLAERIVARYKGKVDYYQLSNELSGVVYYHPTDKGEKLDAGYGLSMDKNRYNHVLEYTKQLSLKIRELDPDAKIIISGHWVLIKPITDLLKDGVQADIIGWNWGSGLSDQPAIKDIDNYGNMDIPRIAREAGKKFMIIEANRDDGSMRNKEIEQAAYIRTLAKNSYENPNVSGYFHFILTDGHDGSPGSFLGLIKLKEENDRFEFDAKKPAYTTLKSYASTHY